MGKRPWLSLFRLFAYVEKALQVTAANLVADCWSSGFLAKGIWAVSQTGKPAINCNL
jgi:hypothetical protein